LQLVLCFDTSAGEQVASWAPDAFVFKTLNTTGASNMARAAEYAVKPLMQVAGDEAAKKPLVMELVGMLGFEPVAAGPLKNARLLEPFAMIWIDQAMKRGRGRNFAFALVKMKCDQCATRRFLGFFFGSPWIVVLSPALWRHADPEGR
jgi:8-hydroxy-5-deazaflavin:NADPH oxidoreductase